MSSYVRLGPDSDDEEESPFSAPPDNHPKQSLLLKEKLKEYLSKVKDVLCSRDLIRSVAVGQLVSVFLCGTAVFSGLLQQQGIYTPTAQSFVNYVLLCLVFTVMLACRYKPEERHLGLMLRYDGWKYAILALIDVEANYLVVKAYTYTTITSIQVLDCCSIVIVLVLSRLLLKTQYAWLHIVGVVVSLTGVAGLVGADVLSGKNSLDTGGQNKPLGDVLVIAGAVLYGVSNVCQEFVVKRYSRTDFLGMIGLFGSLISGIQFIILERGEVAKLDLLSAKVWAPWLGYVLCLFLIYTSMSFAIQQTSATSVNISILSADFYALLFGLFLFHYQFHALYIMAFVVVMAGLVIYSLKPLEGAQQPQVTETQLVEAPPIR